MSTPDETVTVFRHDLEAILPLLRMYADGPSRTAALRFQELLDATAPPKSPEFSDDYRR